MARKDDILQEFLKHPMLQEKYNIDKEELPSTVNEAIRSDVPIIGLISRIVKSLEVDRLNDNELRKQITYYLNNTNIKL
jgi:hypothetical protein